MIRLADQLTLSYCFGVLPLQVALGHVIGAQLGVPLPGAILAGILGLGPIYLFPGFPFAIFCAVVWVVVVPRLLGAVEGSPDTIVIVGGIVAFAVPYLVLLSVIREERSTRRERRQFERSVKGMPLETLVSKLEWVFRVGDEEDERRTIERLREEQGRSVPLILERYRSRRGRRERATLIRALGAIGNPASQAFLREILRSQTKCDLLYAAVESCGEAADAGFIDVLAPLTVDGKDYLVRLKAFEALGKIGTQEAIVVIKQGLDGESDASVVESLTEAAMRGFDSGGSGAAVPWLSEVVSGEAEGPLWLTAVRALGGIGDPEALRILRRVLDGLSDSETIRAVFMGIDNESDRAGAWLADLLRTHENTDVRGRAAEALLNAGTVEGSQIVRQVVSAEKAKPPGQRDERLIEDLDFYITDHMLD